MVEGKVDTTASPRETLELRISKNSETAIRIADESLRRARGYSGWNQGEHILVGIVAAEIFKELSKEE